MKLKEEKIINIALALFAGFVVFVMIYASITINERINRPEYVEQVEFKKYLKLVKDKPYVIYIKGKAYTVTIGEVK